MSGKVSGVKLEGSKLKVSFDAGVDTDKDGQNAAGIEGSFYIDAAEAAQEIFKNGIPEWLKDVLPAGLTTQQVAQVAAPKEVENA